MSDSGFLTSNTLHCWLFSWHRSVPWCAQFPTLLDSFDSFLGKGHSQFEGDCTPDSDNSTCYKWWKQLFLFKSIWSEECLDVVTTFRMQSNNFLAPAEMQNSQNFSGSYKWHSFFVINSLYTLDFTKRSSCLRSHPTWKKIHVILSVTCLVNVVERKITSTHVKFYDINFILNKGTLLSLSNE